MGITTERTFWTSLLALAGEAAPEETVATALRALIALTGSRYARAEVRVLGVEASTLRVEPLPRSMHYRPPPSEIPSGEVLHDRHDTGLVTVELELHSARAGMPLTFRDRDLFDLLFQAMGRLARRVPAEVTSGKTLRQATETFHEQLVSAALRRARGNVSRAARELQVTRGFIYKFMRIAAAKNA